MSIPQHIIDQITDSADLVGLIGRHTTLKKSGTSFKGCCPFHKEKTPSFYVHPDKGYYNCFGCHESGNAISFLMNYEGMSFLEAMDSLSAQTGIAIPKNEPSEKFTYRKTQHHNQTANTTSNASTSSQNPSIANQQQPQQPQQQNPQQTQQPAHHSPSVDSHQAPFADASMPDGFVDDRFEPNFSPPDFSAADFSTTDYAAINDMPEPPAYLDEGAPSAPPSWAESNTMATTAPVAGSTTETPDSSGNLYELLERICVFYQEKLKTHPKALLYLNQRGLSEETLDTFRLGYAPSDWQHLEKAFAQDIEGLKILGLVRENDAGRQYDLLRDRVIFPIRNRRGRIVGFGGRAMSNEVKPKYINSPESVVFKKQHILYGLYEGRKAKATDWLIVEGYMDVIALHQAGIYGAVASMGTATNQEQLKKLFTLNPQLTLAFDGDNAGQKAAWRTLELALPILDDAYELKFLLLPEGSDPDSVIKSDGKDAMLSLLVDAPSLSEFLYAQLSRQFDLSKPEGKSKLMGAAKTLLDTLPQYGSYKKLLRKDLQDRIGIGFNNKKTAQASDALLNFQSQYSLEQQLIFLLLLSPQLLPKVTHLKSLIDTDSQLAQLFALLENTQSMLAAYSTPLAKSHFTLAAWPVAQDASALIAQFSSFYNQLTTLQNTQSTGDLPIQSYHAQFLDELSLQYQEKRLTHQLKQSTSLSETKALNDALSQVRHRLQFREDIN